jgi:hypothetical protein
MADGRPAAALDDEPVVGAEVAEVSGVQGDHRRAPWFLVCSHTSGYSEMVNCAAER